MDAALLNNTPTGDRHRSPRAAGENEIRARVMHPHADSVRVERAQLERLRWLSLVEATTLVVLVGVAAPLKHLADMPAATAVVGPVHGLAFLAYCWTAVQTVSGGGWTGREVGRLVVAALVPFGGFTLGPLLREKAARAAAGGAGVALASSNG